MGRPLTEFELVANENVDRGAKLLDERLPGWYRLINLSLLNILKAQQCILGQIFHRYNDAITALFNKSWCTNSSLDLEYSHGFIGPNASRRERMGVTFDLANDILNKTWRNAINERLEADRNANV